MSFDEAFPLLEATGFDATSLRTLAYNCIAWAAGETDRWWWPDPNEQYYWPEGVPRTVTVDIFLEAFATLGYLKCSDGNFEHGFEKIAIYARNGVPTHASRQLSTGRWTSKLGQEIDISHSIDGVDGPAYGRIVAFMRRPS